MFVISAKCLLQNRIDMVKKIVSHEGVHYKECVQAAIHARTSLSPLLSLSFGMTSSLWIGKGIQWGRGVSVHFRVRQTCLGLN